MTWALTLLWAAQTYGDIAPILRERCLGCHTAKGRMGGLSLESYEGLMEGGSTGPAVVRGRSGESMLYRMVTGKASPAMPMDSSRLSAGEIGLIRRWIDSGAGNSEGKR